MSTSLPLAFHPLTPARWRDFEALFGKSGAYGGCWCVWFRLTRAQFSKGQGAGNKRAMKKIVSAGKPPGLLAYADGRPVGWVAVAPREAYPVLDRSRVAKIRDAANDAVLCCEEVAV